MPALPISNPGPVVQGFGQTPQLIVTQGFNASPSPPPPAVTATQFEIIEAPFNRMLG